MTTIIWSEGKVLTDTRITYLEKDNGTYKRISYSDEGVKIFEPKNLKVGKDRILALAFTGDMRWGRVIPALDRDAGLQSGFYDLKQPNLFSPMYNQVLDMLDSHLIIVTARRVYTLAITRDKEHWCETYPYNNAVGGTAFREASKYVHRLSPFLVMEKLMQEDQFTGGDVMVWEYGKQGIRTHIVENHRFYQARYLASRVFNLTRKLIKLAVLIHRRRTVYADYAPV
jgi:hypothetical protein